MQIKCTLAILLAGILSIMDMNAQIAGVVTDQDGQPLIGATLQLLPDSVSEVTAVDGSFGFQGIKPGPHTLVISYIGYGSTRLKVRSGDEALKVSLSIQEELLETVLVTEEHAKQEASLSTEHFSHQLLEENRQGTFAKSIEQLPGVSAINVGVGIAKPVIRGLSSNRIIVNQQGIKQESHQWGADHGLEVDQYDVERVEIIKGPASLQYGSDGLGGVINILPGRIIEKNSLQGSVEGVYKSNNEHWGGSAYLAANLDDFFVSGRYSRQDFGDYGLPADQFTYNSFVLPIFNNRLKNTAGQEENLRLTAGLKRDWGVSRFLFGHYSLDAGLFSGAVGIPRSYALTDDGNIRDIDVPSQQVDHYRFSFHQSLFWGENHLDFNVGYQRNLRKEFSNPEFHSIPSSQIVLDNTLALQLELETWSANIHYEYYRPSGQKMVLGGNVQWQDNRRAGFEFLLPDFRTFRSGAFVLSEWELSPGWMVNGGLRVDYATNETDFFRQFVWDSNENITDSLIAPVTTTDFFNWSASLGSNWSLLDEQWIIKANIGKSFRVPYPAETVSNGIHHGTFRHEVGTPDLDSEHGYQLDFSLEYNRQKFSGSFSTYFNFLQDYIYLGPTFPARFSPLPEAGQIFQYRQDDAIYTGFELQWEWEFLPGFTLREAADFVQSYNLNTRLALPFTPQPALKHYLRYTLKNRGFLKNLYLEAGHEYYFAAEGRYRIDRSERATPAYQLWSAGTGLKIDFYGQPLQLNVQVQNLMNTFYLNHLSRYRLINVPEQGRNIVIGLKVPFGL
jgi:iron complex outermembrane receptor protein